MDELLKKALEIAKEGLTKKDRTLHEGKSPDGIDKLSEEDQIKVLTEQDDEEMGAPGAPGAPSTPEDEPEEKEKPPEVIKPKPEDEEAPEIIKELVGNTEDTYFYMVSVEDDLGEVKDLNLVDQESVTKFSASEHGIDFGNVPEFLFKGIKELGIENIEFGVFDKYLFPYVFEEEDEDVEDEVEEEEDIEFAKEEEDEFPRESRKMQEEGSKIKAMKEGHLIEMRITDHQNNKFDVYLVDEGLTDTVIDVNGREFNFDAEFASFWKGAGDKLTEEGLRELALDALSSLGEDEYNELVVRSAEQEEPVAAPVGQEEPYVERPDESKTNEATMGVDYVKQAKTSMKQAVAAMKDKDFDLAAKHLEDVADDCNDGAKAAKKMKVAADAKAEKAKEKEVEESIPHEDVCPKCSGELIMDENTQEQHCPECEYVRKGVTEKSAPMCSKCNKAHWPFQKCGAKDEPKEDTDEGLDNPGVRDGTGPARGSAQRQVSGNIGKRKLKGELCPNLEADESVEESQRSEWDKESKRRYDKPYSELTADQRATIKDQVASYSSEEEGKKAREFKQYESVCESRLSKVLHRGDIDEMTHTIMDMLG